MKVDYQLLWDVRPIDLPGRIIKILPTGGGFIRLIVPLRYPDGSFFYPNGDPFNEVFHPNLSKFREGNGVLFSIKEEGPSQRQNRERLGKKMEADQIRLATDDELKAAVTTFQSTKLEKAIEQANQAELNTQEEGRKAQKAEKEYIENLAAINFRIQEIDEEVEQKVHERLAQEREKLDRDRSKLDFERQELGKYRADLREQEELIAPYKKAILFPSTERTTTADVPLPNNLAKIWPRLLRTSGLSFRSDVATAFLLSVAASAFSGSIVLLNGSVGVGKTSLVKQAAQVLGGKCAIIPVRPAWVDPSDLVGFFDPINNTFRPTPFTTALRDVEGNRLRLICLDELNLAKVENYAADLLSCIEYSRSIGKKTEDDNDAGQLKLYSKDIEQQLWEEAKDIAELGDQATPEELRRKRNINTLVTHYPSQSAFPANAVLIGTLNSDETTYDLSPKMIDRSYVITFPSTNFEVFPKEQENPISQIAVTELVTRIDEAMGIPAQHWDIILGWNKELYGLGIPLGHRVRRDYDVFRATGSVLGVSEHECLGYFLFCKILPRIFFFKDQNSNDSPEIRCKNWLGDLKGKYSNFGPVQIIDSMIKMCEDERVPIVRYWSKS